MSNMGAPPHCNHFVIRKKRYCRMTVKTGETYCGEHQPPSAPNENKTRIVCPLDRKHTCYAHNLKKHLKICNARPATPLPHIKIGVNSGEFSSNSTHKLLTDFTPQQIQELIEKVNKIYNDMLENVIVGTNSSHPIVENEMLKSDYGDKSKKHLKQASAILGLLCGNDLIQDKTCFIEFGAGRGQLSYWLAQVIEKSSESSFLLVERSSPKHKQDNKLDRDENEVQRIRADIADLVLDKVESVSKSNHVVGVTKHLCGEATDLAIRCLANLSDQNKFTGCVMTFCCHHRCRWKPYIGKEFFQTCDLSKDDFDMMCAMGSWATCGTGFSRDKNQKSAGENLPQNDRDQQIGVSRLEKEEVGRKCKTILNYGRLMFLKKLGFFTQLYYYVGSEISLENVCIVACKNDRKST